ncbi:MAG TPA: acyl-CoA dehydrogenase family protein [Acidimicrobiia bacterium]|jgi:(2S)-methylsuccinyl-CoA dehydrogenase|nr:acyl-CoA dehydrogenase family protein [Acidimicrobiia bacterium]
MTDSSSSARGDAEGAVEAAAGVVARAAGRLAELAADGTRISVDRLDQHQVLAYDLAHAAAATEGSRVMLEYAQHGELESMLARAYVADAVSDIAARLVGRESVWGSGLDALAGAMPFVEAHRAPSFLAELGDATAQHGTGPGHLSDDFELVAETFRRFADDRIRPVAEHVHRTNGDVPEELITGLAELGGFGLSVPEEYDGFASGGESDYLGMVVSTEELSRGSLGIGGSLITRPEILTRALVTGGTEEQKRRWLPRVATGELMAGIMVTEPDYGSDVAGVSVTATPVDGGWHINGVKTWATFAGRANVIMLLARTDPDRSKGHRGLSVFVVEKEPVAGHSFRFEQPHGGVLDGRAIDTIGYRGMHSFEVSFSDWFVPAENLVGGEEGRGRGFYLQMAGFENGRLQTAARAVGLMQAAFEAGIAYAQERKVFGRAVFDYELTKVKLARMAALIQGGRQFAYAVARQMANGEGTLEASMVKAYVCRAAEWVTREAMQIHGGMGYAEEFPVSRYYVDARVLSIFEGADETLCLRVIARRLAEQALASHS